MLVKAEAVDIVVGRAENQPGKNRTDMNKQIKARWLKALGSGKYKQGTRMLCDKDGNMCCLGVLTDLYIKSKNRTLKHKLKWKWDTNNQEGFALNGEALVLPDAVIKWAETGSDNPEVAKHALSKHNDGGTEYNDHGGEVEVRSKKFPAIANLIEKYL